MSTTNQQNTSQRYAQHGGIGRSAEVAVVMLPFPDHGHLNQLLYLSRLISSYNIPVHFFGIASHIRQVTLRVHGWDPLMDPNIHFHEIHIPPPPKPSAKSPASKLSSFDALVSTVHLHREPFSALLIKLSSVTKRVVVIHDYTMFLVVKDVLTNFPIIAKPDIYSFKGSSAFCSYAIRQELIGEHVLIDGEPAKNFPSAESCWPILVNKYKNYFIDSHTFNHRNVMNTSRVVEGQYIDFLSKEIDANELLDGANEKWAIGPFNPLQIIDNKDSTNRHGCLEWLDKKPPNSVIYVSFGTTTLLSDEQIKEISIGLEKSGHCFIWVVREAAGDQKILSGEHGIDGILPKGYEERVRGRGIIVRDWAPQLEILSHSSTGGFMSHCGWNSCMESVSMGVPIAAWPMQTDQPMNAVLITQVLKVGLVVRDWEHRDELVKSDTIGNAVKRLMEFDEGDALRQKAKELSNAVKGSIKERGIATEEMDAFIAHITRTLIDDGKRDVVVVMVPLPAQGHLNQLLHLSHIVSSYGLPVHFVSTPAHNRQAQVRLHGWGPEATSKIHFHECSVPSFATPSPIPNTANKLSTQLFPSIAATVHLREPVYELLRKLSRTSRRVIVIHDDLMSYVIQDVPSIPNAESYSFQSVSAFTIYTFNRQILGKPVDLANGVPVNDLLSGGPALFPKELADFLKLQQASRKCNWGNLYNTCRVIEGEYLDILAQEKLYDTEKQWAIGPFNPLEINEDQRSEKSHKCLEWLDKQPPMSVIFVSFGTSTSLSDEQVEEIAIGLKNSGQNFIWALRDADRGDVFMGESRKAKLPEGYEERIVKERRGMIVRDWAPQLEILGHSSTGGFMSHCGWNSCIESISLGVPMAAWPMHYDQPRNAFLVTKILITGLRVGDWGHEGELVKANVVENAVKTLMDSAEGKEMRKRAAELSNAIKKSVTRGGENTMTEMDTFISHITR